MVDKMKELNNDSQNGETQRWTDSKLLTIAFFIRLFLILYARIHDYLFKLNFTDVDYDVFTDAAFLVAQGESPYERATYRYTPMIAWLLVPNKIFPDFGKILFSALDVLVGWFHLRILYHEQQQYPGGSQQQQPNSLDASARLHVCLLWLFNPFNAIIAARGNSDSIICFLVLLSMFTLSKSSHSKRMFYASAIIHGAGATHLRIFPVIYLPSIFLHLSQLRELRSGRRGIKSFLRDFFVSNKRGFIYVSLSLFSFSLTTAICYLLYGQKFLDSFLLYHITRVDIRHNFSVHFLPLYLNMNSPFWTKLLGLAAFIPQTICIVAFALRFSNDLPFCWFLTTLTFVSLNKVSTSQYFIWYLCFLPFVYTRIKEQHRRGFYKLIIYWVFAQVIWLLPAYMLEFHGRNTFVWIWLASLIFLCVNFHIVVTLINSYSHKHAVKTRNKED